MAQVLPAKRPRGLTNGVDADPYARRQSRGKRPRQSTLEPSERDLTIETESRPSQDEISSDDDREKADEDAAFTRATQLVERDFRSNVQNVPAEAGIIEEIRCTNFMCHEQLTVTLGPLINFIIGHNGSGKSAVLTAITLCLGGKASATNRGQNLKSFIKEGREYSILSVRLKNQGSGAYKPDQYGNSVIVERHFNRGGTSGFKLKDRNGKIVSTKRADLEDIIDAFALQIDNPMNVLTQDMARQFLNDSSAKEKYKFFLKGTQLETLNTDYIQISRELEEQQSKAEVLKGDLDVVQKKAEAAVRKARQARTLEKNRAREAELARQAAWAQVEAQEEELAQTDAELQRLSKLIESRAAQADIATEDYARADQDLEDAKQSFSDCQTEMEPVEQELQDYKAQFKETREKLIALKTEERQIVDSINHRKKKVEQTRAAIEELQQRQAEADNGVYAEKARELDVAKADSERARVAFSDHDNNLPALKDQLRSAQERMQPTHERLQQKREKERRSQEAIRNLKQGQRKWVESYPNAANLEKLLRAVDTESRFRERPVGPMGRHVELLNPEWGYILEKQFGATLNGFVVTSKADQTILSEMMRKFNYQQPIFIGRNEAIDTTQHEPDRALLTWLRALKINNNLVRNQLIINQSIDQTVLIENRSDAENFMYAGGSARNNVKMCFTMTDNSKRMGHFIQIFQTGATNLGPIGEYKGNLRMQADKEPQIQDEQNNLLAIQREIRNIEASAKELQSELNTYRAKIQEHEKRKKQLKLEFQRAQEIVEQVETELSAATPDAAAIEQLEAELAKAEEEKAFSEGQFGDMVVQKDELNKTARAQKNQMDDATSRRNELQTRLQKIQTKVTTLTSRREEALRSKNAALEDVEAAEKNKLEWEQQRLEKVKDLDETTSQAETICVRVPVPRGQSFDSLNNKRLRLQKEREQHEKELGGSQDELLRKANDAKYAHQEALANYLDCTNVRTHMARSLETRRDRWLRFRREITVRAKVTFNYLLSERKFRGNMNVDHKAGALELQVQPDITEASAAGRQTKTLSGGEKSFSTICLLLALWDAMGSPIRCLDEFDVFMDNVNRQVSMNLMIGAARRSIGRQYILISPQAMGNVDSLADVKIIRMNDPERGQTALNVQRSR